MTTGSPRLEVDGLRGGWDREEVVHQVSFRVEDGELLTLLGPNGSGKTTLLRLIAGFERPTAGSVRLDGRDLAGVPPHRRSIGMLFQEPALFPHRTVLENIAYGPMLRRAADSEVRETVRGLADLLSLAPLLDRWPHQLSGGERQRVALARTLATRPKLVLLDEPFASVDVAVRADLHAEFRRALSELGTTAIHVTHDREEGLFLGDRLALLFAGSLEAVGAPLELYSHPPSARAAAFLGYNVLSGANGPVAVLPNDVEAEPGPRAGPRFTVRASGPVGRQFLTILEGPHRERVEMRGELRLEPGASVALRWSREVALPDALGAPAEPKKPGRLDGR
jgi:ABC-type Fe3+/spermidine/putrescine transport system ATPase subunit